jgi:hypothetical protein
MLNTLCSKRAMTLTEIIIAAMLVSVVMGAGITPFITQQSMIKAQMARSDIQDQVSIALAYINRDVFRAEKIVGTPGSSITLGIGTDFDLGPDQNITYTLNGTDLQRDGNTIARYITVLTFEKQANNFVKVTITASDSDGAQTFTSSTAFALRATRA